MIEERVIGYSRLLYLHYTLSVNYQNAAIARVAASEIISDYLPGYDPIYLA